MAQTCEMRDIRTTRKRKEKEKFNPKRVFTCSGLCFGISALGHETDLH